MNYYFTFLLVRREPDPTNVPQYPLCNDINHKKTRVSMKLKIYFN